MDQLIRGIVKSDQPIPLKGAFLDKISTVAAYGSNTSKEYKTIIDTCLEILYPADENRNNADECFVNDRVEGVLTKWVQHHVGENKTNKPLRIGDVVVMKTLPPNAWRLGRVEALVGPGKKAVRGATLVTRSNGALVTRPLQEIIPLGLSLSEINERTPRQLSVEFMVSEEGSFPTDPSAGSSTDQIVEPTAVASAENNFEFSVELTADATTGEPCTTTSAEPNSEPNVEPSVESTNEDSAEPTVDSTNRRGRKRRGSAVTGEVKRRYTRRK